MLIRSAIGALSGSGERARLSIFIFHRVLPQPDPLFPAEMDVLRFDRAMGWISSWFNVLPLHEAVGRLARGELPRRAAAITFDDGYADNLLYATPILLRHGLHATFFIASGYLDGGRMWNDTIIESVRNATVAELDAEWLGAGVMPLQGAEQKSAAIHRLIPAIKHLPGPARADAVARVEVSCGATLPADLMLTSGQLRQLLGAGMGIGAHTVSHPILARLDADDARREIAASRDALEGLLGERVGLFAYPNGKPGTDYLPEHVDMVRSMGFDAAVSTAWGASDRTSDPFQLRRFTPWDEGRWRYGARLVRNLASPAP